MRKRAELRGDDAPEFTPRRPTLQKSSDRSLALVVRYLDGGRERFFSLLEIAVQHNESYACAWWTVFSDLNETERSKVALDDICLAADVPADVLMGIVVQYGMRYGADVSKLVAAAAHPKIVQASIKYAQKSGGVEDRKMLHQAMGFLPTSKGGGPVTNVYASAAAQAAARADESTSPKDANAPAAIDVPATPVRRLPSFLQDVESVRQLPEHTGVEITESF